MCHSHKHSTRDTGVSCCPVVTGSGVGLCSGSRCMRVYTYLLRRTSVSCHRVSSGDCLQQCAWKHTVLNRSIFQPITLRIFLEKLFWNMSSFMAKVQVSTPFMHLQFWNSACAGCYIPAPRTGVGQASTHRIVQTGRLVMYKGRRQKQHLLMNRSLQCLTLQLSSKRPN